MKQTNIFHFTVNFIPEYLKEEVNFLRENIKLIDG